jgi:hypothetical protein
MVNGKIAPEEDGVTANNRAILIDGSGSEVLFRTGAVATGKTYYDHPNVNASEHGSGIRVIKMTGGVIYGEEVPDPQGNAVDATPPYGGGALPATDDTGLGERMNKR